MTATRGSARAEWSAFWFLPVVAAIGQSSSGMHVYVPGPFMEPLHNEFGWNRAELSAGVTIVNLVAVISTIILGAIVDRIGPRKVALTGTLLMCTSIALLSTATGTVANWIFLWVIIAICAIAVQTTVWTSAVVRHFEASRGLALAITLSGTSLTAMIMPLLATALIDLLGWRLAFVGIGAIWLLLTFPLLFLYFRVAVGPGADESLAKPGTSPASLTGLSIGQALRTMAFYKLLFAGGLFAFAVISSVFHFVPLVSDSGATRLTAASAASLLGISSLFGRLSTGFLLDRFPAQVVGAAAMFLPVPGMILLLVPGYEPYSYFIAAVAIGFSLGAEFDVIAYLAARLFGLANFGKIFGALICAVALGGSVGPLAAGAIFDRFDGYDAFLMLSVGLLVVSSLAVATLPRRPAVQATA